MKSNVLNLLAVWKRRPQHVLEFGNEEDWAYAVELMTAVKNIIPALESVVNTVQNSNALPSTLIRNPESVVSDTPNASEGNVERNAPWRPRWEREEPTSPIPAPEVAVVATPNSGVPSSQAGAPSNHSQALNQNAADTDASSGQTTGTSDKPESVSSRLAAARKVAAKSKTPSSRVRKGKRTKVTTSTLP